MGIVEQIKLFCPFHIAKLYEAMSLEDTSRQRERVRKLIDLFEGIVRYLALIGLASYRHYKLSDDKVERIRSELERPSLGSWVSLLRNLDVTLQAHHKISLFATPLNKTRTNDPIVEAFQVMSHIIDMPQPKKMNLIHFLDSTVEFRNKIAHETLSRHEAKQVLFPLESAINQWITELSILQQQHLVYIDHVEWRDQHFICRGINLNTGLSQSSTRLERNEPVTGEQVYLYQPIATHLIPLHPFFVFDNDSRLLYIYTRLSDKRELTLRCPYYEIPGAKPAYYISYDESVITGVKLTEKPITISELSKEGVPSSRDEDEKMPEPSKEKELSDYIQEEKSSAPIQEERLFEKGLSDFTQEEKPSVSFKTEEQHKSTNEENLFSHFENTELYEEISLHSPFEKEEIDGDANEIKLFFANMPRFNVVLIKTTQPVSLRNLSQKLEFQIIDLKNLVMQGKVRLEEIDGYNDLLRILNEICSNVKEQGVTFTHLDLLLSTLDRDKRKRFFERVLQKTFSRSAVFSTALFRDEIPDVRHQKFNYAKVIEWER